MQYQLTVKDTETGETVLDENVDSIIISAHGEKHTCSTLLSKCDAFGIINVYYGALTILERLDKDHPGLAGIARLYKKVGDHKLEKQN